MNGLRCFSPASLITAGLLSLVCLGCEPPSPPASQTLEGPESSKLVESVQGYVVALDEEAMYALSLPKLDRRVLVARADFPGRDVHSLSGPNASGTLVYIEGQFGGNPRYALRKLNLENSDNTVVLERPGDTIWGDEVGDYLALSPASEQVALLERLQDKQMPKALLEVGSLELVDLKDGTQKTLRQNVLNQPLSWFPDGVRLAYARMTPRTDLAVGTLGLEEFGVYFQHKWDELPAIFILDTTTGKEELLCVGWEACVDAKGASVLVGGWGQTGHHYVLVYLQAKTLKAHSPPGIAAAVVGRPTTNLLIYGALPTAGTSIRMMEHYSPLRGPRPLVTIKLADLPTGDFQTLVPYVDPRGPTSFGQTSAQLHPGAK